MLSEGRTHVWRVVWTYAESRKRSSMASCTNSRRMKGARIYGESFGFMPSKGSVYQWLVVPIHADWRKHASVAAYVDSCRVKEAYING